MNLLMRKNRRRYRTLHAGLNDLLTVVSGPELRDAIAKPHEGGPHWRENLWDLKRMGRRCEINDVSLVPFSQISSIPTLRVLNYFYSDRWKLYLMNDVYFNEFTDLQVIKKNSLKTIFLNANILIFFSNLLSNVIYYFIKLRSHDTCWLDIIAWIGE